MFVHMNDMTGRRFGKLTVVRRVENNKYGQPMFLCTCDCGREHVTAKGSLVRTSGGAKSCGCALYASKKSRPDYRAGGASRRTMEVIYPELPSSLQQRVCNIKKGIYRGSKTLELSDDQILWLILKPCKYCGFQDIEKGIGIDRVDSAIHYRWDNCAPCCKTCNFAKNNLTQEQFKQWISRVYEKFVVAS